MGFGFKLSRGLDRDIFVTFDRVCAVILGIKGSNLLTDSHVVSVVIVRERYFLF